MLPDESDPIWTLSVVGQLDFMSGPDTGPIYEYLGMRGNRVGFADGGVGRHPLIQFFDVQDDGTILAGPSLLVDDADFIHDVSYHWIEDGILIALFSTHADDDAWLAYNGRNTEPATHRVRRYAVGDSALTLLEEATFLDDLGLPETWSGEAARWQAYSPFAGEVVIWRLSMTTSGSYTYWTRPVSASAIGSLSGPTETASLEPWYPIGPSTVTPRALSSGSWYFGWYTLGYPYPNRALIGTLGGSKIESDWLDFVEAQRFTRDTPDGDERWEVIPPYAIPNEMYGTGLNADQGLFATSDGLIRGFRTLAVSDSGVTSETNYYAVPDEIPTGGYVYAEWPWTIPHPRGDGTYFLGYQVYDDSYTEAAVAFVNDPFGDPTTWFGRFPADWADPYAWPLGVTENGWPVSMVKTYSVGPQTYSLHTWFPNTEISGDLDLTRVRFT